MSKFSERLKDERQRLGLSQTAFAESLGVHRNTQIKYESGERHPDSIYLDAAGKAGVDVMYLYSGVRQEERETYDIAQARLAEGVYEAIGFSSDEVKKATLELGKLIDADLESGGCLETDEQWGLVTFPAFLADFLGKSPVLSTNKGVHDVFSIDLLATVLTGVEGALFAHGQTISPAKKAQAVAMLYRSFKASGKVDPAMIEEAVTLAAD